MRFLSGRVAVSLAVACCLVTAACGSNDDRVPVLDTSVRPTSPDDFSTSSENPDKPDVSLPAELPTELVITDLIEGTGDPAKDGDTLSVNYVGVLSKDGTEFDNSYDGGSPITVVLGTGGVIEGWDLGLVGVKAGGRRQLDIPAELAYGDQGSGDIQPGEALSFVIDVVSIEPKPELPAMAEASECPAADGSSDQQLEFTDYPPTCIDVTKYYAAEIKTNMGSFTVQLDAEKAPFAVNNFVTLARYHYFDDSDCHRIIPAYIAQCGDPTGTGHGNPGYTFIDELPQYGDYQVGSFVMANGGPDTNGSQFFIITGDRGTGLPPSYTLFGTVTDGLDSTITKIDAAGNPNDNGMPPLKPVTIESVTITESSTAPAPPPTTVPATTSPTGTVTETTTASSSG
jgi:cyclophilin family peptidyl-prolyl cis-trans isomerase